MNLYCKIYIKIMFICNIILYSYVILVVVIFVIKIYYVNAYCKYLPILYIFYT